MISIVKIINISSPHMVIFLCVFVTNALETHPSEHISEFSAVFLSIVTIPVL